MCGIFGYVGGRDATPILLDGLQRLEYRGYDSAGLAVIGPDGRIAVRREAGKLSRLIELVATAPLSGRVGVGHTRWATHGAPCRRNAHPHLGANGHLAAVHNGIIENHAALREHVLAQGRRCLSETDSEVVVQLVEAALEQEADLETAVRQTLALVQGASAFVFVSAHAPDRLVAARLGHAGGLVLGLGDGEMFVASDLPALLVHTRQVIFLEDGQLAVVTAQGVTLSRLDGAPVEPRVHLAPWDPTAATKEPYPHFMLKEIHEQAQAVTDTLRGRADFEAGRVRLEGLALTAQEARALERLVIVACGTSAYAGLVGKFIIERLARLPVEVDYASEFRYRDPLLGPRTAVLAITQSGETADTLAAMALARAAGAPLWAIVNAPGSQAERLADGVIAMRAGPEIGVASTKAFTASLVDLYLLGCLLGERRGTLSRQALQGHVADLAGLPGRIGDVLAAAEGVRALAEAFRGRSHALYLGRGIHYPIALEGALKMKEISYLHAEGYPAGEMKHGPIALVDGTMPVVALAPRDRTYDKMSGQIEQVRARGGTVLALATDGDSEIAARADYVFRLPPTPELLAPVVSIAPLQLLAYYVALERGCDVDRPRNLAKSVTVE